jgi:hypothetical protein
MFDDTYGLSNCVDIMVVDQMPAPVLTIGGSLGPANFTAPTGPIEFLATGFVPPSYGTHSVFANGTCSGTALDSVDVFSNMYGQIAFSYGSDSVGTFSVNINGPRFEGLSNCVVVNVMTAPPTPTNTPLATATSTPTEIPVGPGDSTLTVTADPRFPLTGSAAISEATIYTLNQLPANGTVLVTTDGTYTYQAYNPYLAGDTFTITAAGPNGSATVTIVITYAINPTVSTNGSVNPGHTGSGGSTTDPRGSRSPQPTSTPDAGDEPTEAR